MADQRTIAIVGVQLAGDAAPELQQQVARSLVEVLARSAEVIPLAESRESLAQTPALVDCHTSACAEQIAEQLAADHLVRAHVRADGATYTVELELWRPPWGDVHGRVRRTARCTVCTITELGELVARLATSLDGPASESEGPEPLAAAPGGAELPIPVPPTPPRAGPAAATPAPQHRPASPGAQLSAAPPPRAQGTPALLRWGLVGGGAVALATGVTLLLLDGNQTCERSDPRSQCPSLYDTRTAGWIGVGVGVACAAAGGWLFWRDRERTAALSAAPGQASIRFTAHF
jgi:hypothetical protein